MLTSLRLAFECSAGRLVRVNSGTRAGPARKSYGNEWRIGDGVRAQLGRLIEPFLCVACSLAACQPLACHACSFPPRTRAAMDIQLREKRGPLCGPSGAAKSELRFDPPAER